MVNDPQSCIKRLSSGNAAEQAAAAEALARMGKVAQPAATALVSALRIADAKTCEWCTAALEDLGPPSATDIPELTRLAGDKSLDVAYWAITLLGRAGNDAAPSMPTLVDLLSSSETTLKERAAWALGKIGPAATTAVPALRAAAAGREPRLSRLAKQALDKIES
jgi:HEAT repeat protein